MRRHLGDVVVGAAVVVVVVWALLGIRGSSQRDRRLFDACLADGYAEYQCFGRVYGGWRWRR